MKVHLPRYGERSVDLMADVFERLAKTSARHELVADADGADAVLFTQSHVMPGWPARTARSGAFSGRACFVYDERDMPWCELPGLYVSMPSTAIVPRHQRPVPYAWIDDEEFVALRDGPPPSQLFSFVGGRTHRIRDEIFSLSHPGATLMDSGSFVFHARDDPAYPEARRRFLDTIADSRFVLAPRGHGTATIRLFETIAAGRVPVIVSDTWEPPAGPDWSRFSVRISEREVATIPAVLEGLADQSEIMSAAATAAYDQYFSQRNRFDYMADQIGQLLDAAADFPRRGVRNSQYVRVQARRAKATTVSSIRRLRDRAATRSAAAANRDAEAPVIR